MWTTDLPTGLGECLRRTGHRQVHLPVQYLGADDQAGPNYTGQPAVNSYYGELNRGWIPPAR
ncbi:hypothetical protein GCM10029964_064560 [Kibdelosporangium lantanae]